MQFEIQNRRRRLGGEDGVRDARGLQDFLQNAVDCSCRLRLQQFVKQMIPTRSTRGIRRNGCASRNAGGQTVRHSLQMMFAVEQVLAPMVVAELLDVCLAATAGDELIREALCQISTNLLISLTWNKRSHDCPPNCPFEKTSTAAERAWWIGSL